MARRITSVVYLKNGTTLAGGTLSASTLTTDSNRKWLDDFNDVGSGSLEVQEGSSDEALLDDGRIVRFFLDGVARFAWRIEGFSKVVADPSTRAAGNIVKVEGRGLLSLV